MTNTAKMTLKCAIPAVLGACVILGIQFGLAPKPAGAATRTADAGEARGLPVLVEISSGTMKRVDAEFERGVVTVHAEAELSDQRPDNVYAWALQVVDSGGKVGLFQVYDHQPFHVVPGESFKPPFDEEFPMNFPPGTYRAKVFVFRVRADRQLDRVSGEEFAKHFQRDYTGCMGAARFVVR
ncbi:hypothetical protein [Tautonia rosea]|uniref:hypothetical protein n=1 Tax=Tautonia rosea TaxID=2728037 RepID=UPI00147414CE|nr:hypothetical protein [Tautonia rosea]